MQVARWVAIVAVVVGCVAVPAIATGALVTAGGEVAPVDTLPAPAPDGYAGSAQRAQSPAARTTAPNVPTQKAPTQKAPVPKSPAPKAPASVPGGGASVTPGGGRTIEVGSDAALKAAITAAGPGDTIRLAPGRYAPIVITSAGTAGAPITLSGPEGAVIAGGGSGYVVHLDGARYWQLTGFTVTGGGKGIMTDGADHVVLDALTVGNTADEAVHFRGFSSDNVIRNSRIHDTGRKQAQYGEGVYVGSAKSNWGRHSGGRPDLSMRNRIVDNVFQRITAENVDIKEETGGTVVSGNRFDGSATSGENYADSVVDIKGHDSRVVDNVTTGNSPNLKNIIETHVITSPATSGCGNTIEGNTVEGFTPAGQLVSVDKKCG